MNSPARETLITFQGKQRDNQNHFSRVVKMADAWGGNDSIRIRPRFTGDPSGPTLSHLKQDWAAQLTDIKLKPQGD